MSCIPVGRRTFLATAAGAIAAGQFAHCATTSTDLPSLGFSLYGMKSLSLTAALRSCAEIGYRHVELALMPGYPSEPAVFSTEERKQTAATLEQLSLELPGLMLLLNLAADDTAHAAGLELIKAASQLGRDLVPGRPPLLETVLGSKPALWEQQKSRLTDRLHEWATTAEACGTTIAIKAHVTSAVNSPERLLWLLEQVKSPAIQVAYDYSHFELQGISLAESLSLLLPRTQFIHVKDCRGDANKFQFLLPGEGRTDYVEYFSLLRKQGYSGPVCVEVSGQISGKADYAPLAAARKCYDTLSAAMTRAFA
jgi:sugar phosphate isomerase/epimerase